MTRAIVVQGQGEDGQRCLSESIGVYPVGEVARWHRLFVDQLPPAAEPRRTEPHSSAGSSCCQATQRGVRRRSSAPQHQRLAEDTDIQGIAIASFGRRRESAHVLVTVGSRDKPVQRRVLCGRALRSIDAKVPRDFVHLILHEVERCDFDVRVENPRRVRASLQTMPRVRSEMVGGAVARGAPTPGRSWSCRHLGVITRPGRLPAQRPV